MKFKAKVDPARFIVVLSPDDAHPDFPNPPEISDGDLRGGYQVYITKDTEVLKECRRSCFCVLAHGIPESFAGMGAQDSLGLISNYYHTYSQGRQLLLLSCLTGLKLARQLSPMLRVDIIAPTGVAAINSHGYIGCIPRSPGTPGADDRPNSGLNWIRLKPSGEIVMLGSELLTAQFVKPQ